MPRQREALPPVVKLILSFLAFETAGPAPPTAAPPGQRTLRNMMWLEKATSTRTAALAKGPHGAASPPPSESRTSGESAAATAVEVVPKTVATSPVARVAAPAGNLGSITDHAAGLLKAGELTDGSRKSIPRKAEETGSVLVRCPRCKACLPVGEAWDAHREEEHLIAAAPSDHPEPPGVRRNRRATLHHQAVPSSLSPSPLSAIPPQHRPLSSLELVEAATGTRKTLVAVNAGRSEGDFVDFGEGVPPSDAEVRTPIQGAAGGSSDGDSERRQSRKLSHLLMIAVMPEQAAGVLRDRGFLRDDGQTRFANLGLVGDDLPRDQQEETALEE